MPRLEKSARNELDPAKLKRLEKLASETAELSIDIIRDLISGNSTPWPPKPQKLAALSSIPDPPKPKLDELVSIAYGARTIELSVSALGQQ